MEMIKEDHTISVRKSGVFTKIERCITHLYATMKEFRTANLKQEFKDFGLGTNARTAISPIILESSNNGHSKQFKWKLPDAPSKKLVEELYDKTRAYNERCENNTMKNRANNTQRVIKNPSKKTKEPILIKKNPALVPNNALHINDLDIVLQSLEARRNGLLAALADTDAKIKEANEIKTLREKEKNFFSTLTGGRTLSGDTVTLVDTVKVPYTPKKVVVAPKRHYDKTSRHERVVILNILSRKGQTSLQELVHELYPDKEFAWKDPRIKSLSNMMTNMKREKLIEKAGKSLYKLTSL
jgi:hypothetical protein